MKALALISGGLDSILAVKVVQEAGIEVETIHFMIPFLQTPDTINGEGHAAHAARQLNVKLHYQKCGEDYLDMIGKPQHGYGKRMNPCVDCRIYTFKKAAQKMLEIGASFLVTGEVCDQRPNSQRLDALDITARDAGMKDLVLRPLSAKLLRPTIPEEQGWIDRTRLLDIKGRGRTQQIELAAKYGITNYPAPAGGCLLTNEEYSLKVKDLLEHEGKLTMYSINLLRFGRHMRLRKPPLRKRFFSSWPISLDLLRCLPVLPRKA
jgi:tRNA U34 2-thiouridine synthase MnmA/TrmU